MAGLVADNAAERDIVEDTAAEEGSDFDTSSASMKGRTLGMKSCQSEEVLDLSIAEQSRILAVDVGRDLREGRRVWRWTRQQRER